MARPPAFGSPRFLRLVALIVRERFRGGSASRESPVEWDDRRRELTEAYRREQEQRKPDDG